MAATADPKAAEAWAAEPTDAHRRAAFAADEVVGLGCPAGAVGAAVFLMEGSLAPPKQPAVPPAPHVAHTTVGNAVRLAAVVAEPEQAPGRLRQFVALGAEVAAGRDRWTEPRPTAGGRAAAAAPSGGTGSPRPLPVSPPPPRRS